MFLIFIILTTAAGFLLVSPSGKAIYGVYTAAAILLASVLAAVVALPSVVPDAVAYVLVIAAVVAAVYDGRRMRSEQTHPRYAFERLFSHILLSAAVIAVFVTFGIVASVFFESVRFFQAVPFFDFLLGLHWSPQIAIREDQVGATGSFGFVPLIVGTLLISLIAMAVALPMGLFAAIYLSEFAARKTRATVKPILEILAGIPTIVYGFFALTVLSPFIVNLGRELNIGIVSENALAAGIVMGMMLIPFVASLAEDAFHAVPDYLRQGALGVGSTRYEATTKVVIPAAFSGVVAGVLLAFSRAVGETMIVVMAAGISANLSVNPLAAVTTVTVQIVTLLTGDQEFNDPKTLAAFALGLTLFFITLLFNLLALYTMRKYREQYE